MDNFGKLIFCLSLAASTVILGGFLAGHFASGADFSFKSNLKYGDVSPDVLQLQEILNQSSDIMVALSGPGSPGQETDYFGSLTEAAVIKFQEKYKSEILLPWGLGSGSGFVGISTRTKLNLILAASQKAAPTSPAENLPASQNTSSLYGSSSLSAVIASSSDNAAVYSFLPIVENLSGIDFSSGDSLTITGANFTGSVAVHIGDKIYDNPVVESQSKISVAVPNQPGVLLVWVGNGKGDSRADFPMFIVVRDKSVDNPIIPGVLEKVQENNDIINQKAVKVLSGSY